MSLKDSKNSLFVYEDLMLGLSYLSRRVLAKAGFAAARDFYETQVSGSGAKIQYRPASHSSTGAPMTRSGRRMVLYGINGKGTILSLSSFPLNLFEHGRKLRSGKREGARNILKNYRNTFYSIARARAGEALSEFLKDPDNDLLSEKAIDKKIRQQVYANGAGKGTSGSSSAGGSGGRLFGIEAEWKK